MAGLSTRTTDSNKKFNPHLHIRKHADEDFLCTQQYFHRKSSSYLSPIQQDDIIYQNVTFPTPSPKPLYFLAPPPIHSKSASRTAYQIPKRNAITQTPTPKASKKSNSNTTAQKSPKKNLQKGNPKQSIKLHQLENTPTQTAIQIQQTTSLIPLKTHTPQNARTFPLKRKCISPQTPKSSLPNASAFHLKHKDV